MAQQSVIKAILTLNSEQFTTALERAQSRLSRFGSRLTRTGRDLTFSLTLPLAAAAKQIVEVGTSFDLIQRKIGALGGTGVVDNLANSARNLGATTIFTATQVGELQLNLRKLGRSNQEILQLEGTVLKFAQAMDTDLGEAGTFVVQTMNRFNEELSDVGDTAAQAEFVTNVFAKAAAESALDVDKLRSALNFAGSELAQYDISLTSTTALLAVLANNGFEASRGGTALRRVIAELAKSGISGDEAIRKLLNSSGGFAEQLEEFGLRGAGSASALAGMTDEFERLKTELENSTGFLDKFAELLGESTFAKVKEFQSALQALAEDIFQTIQPALNSILEDLAAFIRQLRFLSPEVKTAASALTVFLAALGPISLLIGGLTTALSGFLGFLSRIGGLLSRVVVPIFRVLFTVLSSLSPPLRILTVVLTAAAAAFGIKSKAIREEQEKLAESTRSLKKVIEEQNEAFASLDDLDTDEILRRINNGALDLMRGFQSGTLAVTPDLIADSFIPQQVFEEIEQRFQELKNNIDGVETFGQVLTDAQLLEEVLQRLFGRSAPPSRTENPIEDELSTLTSIVKLKDDLAELARQKAILLGEGLNQQDRENFLVDPDAVKQLDTEIKKLQSTLDALDVEPLTELPSLDLDDPDAFGNFSKNIVAAIEGSEVLSRSLGIVPELITRSAEEQKKFAEKIQDAGRDQNRFLRDLRQLENTAVNIGSVFGDAFLQAAAGTETFADALKNNLIDAINRVIARLIALIAAYLVLLVVSGGTSSVAQLAGNLVGSGGEGFVNFIGQGFGIPMNRSMQMQIGTISGSDLALTTRRGVTANDRIYG